MKHNAEDYKSYVGKKAGIILAGILLCVVLFAKHPICGMGRSIWGV